MKKKIVIFSCFFFLYGIFFCCTLFGQSLFQRGEELFMRNQPREAISLLESALSQESRNEKIYLYLGIAYEQIGNNDRAISIMQRGLEFAYLHRDLLLFNLGNNYFAKGDGEKALEMYTRAIEANGNLTDAYLNRANVNVKQSNLGDAVRDYRLYLTLNPETSQRYQIEEMIRLIEGIQAEKIAEAERLRLTEEERLRAEEERKLRAEELRAQDEERRRIAEEQRRLEEEARQKALLDEVLKSLQMASDSTTNLSAGKEDIIEHRDDIDIED